MRKGGFLHKALLAAAAALMFTTVHAQTGANAYSFLNIPTSAHVLGLGGVNPSLIDDDVTLVDQNPALLGSEIEKQVAFNYMNYFGSGNFAGVRYGMAASEHGAWSAGIRYLNFGSMQGYDPDGSATGTFTPQDVVFEGSYAHDFNDRWRGGIMLRMVYSSYEQYNAFAMAADLGVNYYDEEHDLSLSAVITNAGGQLKRFHHAYDRLPFDIRLGYMQGLGHSPFSLSITAWNLTKWRLPAYGHNSDSNAGPEITNKFFPNFFRHFIFGIQYQPSYNFYLTLAYNYKTRSDMTTYQRNFLSGFSIGAGIKVKSFGIGIGFAQPHKGGTSLLVNISTNLSELIP